VMVPYWIITIVVLFLDYILLKRAYAVDDIVLTFLGINLTIDLSHIDYVRWFVTFILLWYLLFYIFNYLTCQNHTAFILLGISHFLLPVNYYILHLEWYQFIAFPVGCLLAAYYNKIQIIYKNNRVISVYAATVTLLCILFYKYCMGHEELFNKVYGAIPNILLVYFAEVNGIFLCVALAVLVLRVLETGFHFNILLLLGKYSYEIFLLHGVFLIKYDPFIVSGGTFSTVVGFSILFIFVCTISTILSDSLQVIDERL